MDIIASKSASVNGYEFIAPNMDSVFFHEDRFEVLNTLLLVFKVNRSNLILDSYRCSRF